MEGDVQMGTESYICREPRPVRDPEKSISGSEVKRSPFWGQRSRSQNWSLVRGRGKNVRVRRRGSKPPLSATQSQVPPFIQLN
jgi:hypothetical protein